MTICVSRLRQPSGFRSQYSGLQYFSVCSIHRPAGTRIVPNPQAPRHEGVQATSPLPCGRDALVPQRDQLSGFSTQVSHPPSSRNERLSAPSAFRFQVSVLRSSVFQRLFHPPPGGCPIGRSSHKLRFQPSALRSQVSHRPPGPIRCMIDHKQQSLTPILTLVL